MNKIEETNEKIIKLQNENIVALKEIVKAKDLIIKELKEQLTIPVVRRSAMLAVDTFSKQSTYNVPIWVYEVVDDDILPIKFEYKAKGYKGLRFSERKQRVVFD